MGEGPSRFDRIRAPVGLASMHADGSNLVRAVPNAGGGWELREPGSSRVPAQAPDKDAAVRRAWSVMANGGVIQILDVHGFLVETRTVPSPAGRPRGYVPPLTRGLVVLLLLQESSGSSTTGTVGWDSGCTSPWFS